jgi:hypothetical protein
MSSINEQKGPATDAETSTGLGATVETLESGKSGKPTPADASPQDVRESTTTGTTPSMPTKIFGSFTSEAQKGPSKEAPTSKPLFGGFTGGLGGSGSAWAAPATLGGFGASSSIVQPQSSADDNEVSVLH